MEITSTLLLMVLLHSCIQPSKAVPISPVSQDLADPKYGPIPGQDALFSKEMSKGRVFPADYTDPIHPTVNGASGPDDLLFQNLLSAEWVIYSFYQRAVEIYNTTTFTALGFPNTTYQRVTEIRNNEAGHLRIFQNQISEHSVKPGACRYAFPFTHDTPSTFLALVTLLEISSMAFLTGLVQQANLNVSKGALMAIAETETRHNTWSLIDIWNVSPFAGPSDTSYPYASQIIAGVDAFIVPGSCPSENPPFPSPNQKLPSFSAATGTKSLAPGANVAFNFSNPLNQPSFDPEKEYYAVYFHGMFNISVPFDTTTNRSTIPAYIESERGVVIVVIADEEGAPTLESVVAGPGVILQQPAELAILLSSS